MPGPLNSGTDQLLWSSCGCEVRAAAMDRTNSLATRLAFPCRPVTSCQEHAAAESSHFTKQFMLGEKSLNQIYHVAQGQFVFLLLDENDEDNVFTFHWPSEEYCELIWQSSIISRLGCSKKGLGTPFNVFQLPFMRETTQYQVHSCVKFCFEGINSTQVLILHQYRYNE